MDLQYKAKKVKVLIKAPTVKYLLTESPGCARLYLNHLFTLKAAWDITLAASLRGGDDFYQQAKRQYGLKINLQILQSRQIFFIFSNLITLERNIFLRLKLPSLSLSPPHFRLTIVRWAAKTRISPHLAAGDCSETDFRSWRLSANSNLVL